MFIFFSQKSTFHYVENELWNLIPKQFKGVSRTSQLSVLFVFQIYAHNDALFRSHQSYISLSFPVPLCICSASVKKKRKERKKKIKTKL